MQILHNLSVVSDMKEKCLGREAKRGVMEEV